MEPQRFIESERTATAKNASNPWSWVESDISAPSVFNHLPSPYDSELNVSAYNFDYMSWKPTVSNETGGLDFSPMEASGELNIDSQDRITLLSKKYASSSLNLKIEDSARLKILDERMSLNNPRYLDSDLEVIERAENLLSKLYK